MRTSWLELYRFLLFTVSMNFSVISLIVRPGPNEPLTLYFQLICETWSREIKLIKLVILSSHLVFFKYIKKIGNDSFISVAFLSLPKKKCFFCKLQLFPQNTDVLHVKEGFCICQKNIAQYNTLQIPKENFFLKSTIKTTRRYQ